MQNDLIRPIIGIENRTAQEVFDIMCDRFRHLSATVPAGDGELDTIALDITKRIEREFYYDQPGGSTQTRAKVQCIISDALAASRLSQGTGDWWPSGQFKFGDRVEKSKGAAWHGRVCGWYTTALTPVGYAVESEREPGSVQIYPEAALSQGETV